LQRSAVSPAGISMKSKNLFILCAYFDLLSFDFKEKRNSEYGSISLVSCNI
jgi:hypothetical protein